MDLSWICINTICPSTMVLSPSTMVLSLFIMVLYQHNNHTYIYDTPLYHGFITDFLYTHMCFVYHQYMYFLNPNPIHTQYLPTALPVCTLVFHMIHLSYMDYDTYTGAYMYNPLHPPSATRHNSQALHHTQDLSYGFPTDQSTSIPR